MSSSTENVDYLDARGESNSKGPYRHPDYYLDDIVFLVEDQLFKVPRRNFVNESEMFADMFQLPACGNEEGSSDKNPIRLERYKKHDFLQLLRVMFPPDSQHPEVLTLEEWKSVLDLSTKWNFHRIRATAIKNMEALSMDLVDKLVIARRCDVAAWLVPSLNELIQRADPISLTEGHRLGMEWVLKVAEVRECNASTDRNRTCPSCRHTGPVRCNSCSSTSFNRCSNCNTVLPAPITINNTTKRGSREDIDYSEKIRAVFQLA